MNKKNIGIFFFFCIDILISYFFFKNIRHEKDNSVLIVGTAAGYAPFVSINQQGNYEGFDIDVAHALARTLDKKLEIKDLGSMTSLLIALEQGSIDAIIWGMSITQDRLNKFALVHYQGRDTKSHPLIFWKNIPAGIKGLEDMKGMTVCVEPSSAQSAILDKYKEILIKSTEKVDDALLNIQYGKADAAFVEEAIARKFCRKHPEIKTLDIPLPPENYEYGIGIVIKKQNQDLINQIQYAINQLKQDGTIKKYATKWDLE
jgi:polar amino acid transport system substrate-binding protein